MRKQFLGFAAAAVLLFVSATDWDGAAIVDPSGTLSAIDFCIATNAFPRNTVVDVTNLENYQTVRVIVVSELSTAGLLATLSRRAGEAIGIRGNSVYRIRMSQPPDEIAFSYLQQHGLQYTAQAVNEDGDFDDEYELADSPKEESASELAVVPHDNPAPAAETESADTDTGKELSLVPSEERIPEGSEYEISPDDFVPAIAPREYEFIAEIPPQEIPAAEESYTAVSPESSPFSAPLIRTLESGSWYVQVAAYSRYDYVENEINRIGTDYPLAIQNIGTETNPMFRVLLGPLNQGEGGAMLQRMKSIGYRDAFVRKN